VIKHYPELLTCKTADSQRNWDKNEPQYINVSCSRFSYVECRTPLLTLKFTLRTPSLSSYSIRSMIEKLN